MKTHHFPLDVTHDVLCVLYAEGTGEIAFVHRVTTLGDAPRHSEADIERDARRHMQDSVLQPPRPAHGGLRSLFVPVEALRRGHRYSVDCASRTLREHPYASSGTSGSAQ